eukprot:gene34456-44523_t
MDLRTVGILGSGQLGRMMIESGSKLGIKIAILGPGGSSSPAGQLSQLSLDGDVKDHAKVKELASISDVITTELEDVDTDILEELENGGHEVCPNSSTIRIIQDKFLQKEHLHRKAEIPLPDFQLVDSLLAAREAGLRFGYPYMLKLRKQAYDGKGNCVVHSEETVEAAYDKLRKSCSNNSSSAELLYAERWVPFVKELAVMVVRTKDGQVISYPVVETIQKDSICHIVIAPAQISSVAERNASSVALKAISTFNGVGIFGIELPHNSGHYTIEACDIDQFEMHLRAVLGLPCPQPSMKVKAAMMVNVIGNSSNMEETKSLLRSALGIPGAGIHWYGKFDSRVGRKMAHVTITADDISSLIDKAEQLGVSTTALGLAKSGPQVAIIMGSDSDLPCMKEAALFKIIQVSYELTIVSAHRTPTRMYSFAQSCAERGIKVIIAGAGGAAHLPGMVAALTSLPVIGVPVKSSNLNGEDSLLSIVQMPRGVPVATVAIGNATNAGLLAVRILGCCDSRSRLLASMDQYMLDQEEEVLGKAAKLEAVGYKTYLKESVSPSSSSGP